MFHEPHRDSELKLAETGARTQKAKSSLPTLSGQREPFEERSSKSGIGVPGKAPLAKLEVNKKAVTASSIMNIHEPRSFA